ncbi:hypothetical protein RFI_10108 [Reticulomyxa filosa]|uniref:Uncharacterized protein n=1 Tax=Reticulomyxa filosa TaxID=46433 RepID=X6NM79_RETFI|nr:hypothetical protein RFI_10108 [Reticulomyxa filosa]|eukprot:ETO27023.1 hypothetical protein RFI_10108 [Reticulomyxa filosa]
MTEYREREQMRRQEQKNQRKIKTLDPVEEKDNTKNVTPKLTNLNETKTAAPSLKKSGEAGNKSTLGTVPHIKKNYDIKPSITNSKPTNSKEVAELRAHEQNSLFQSLLTFSNQNNSTYQIKLTKINPVHFLPLSLTPLLQTNQAGQSNKRDYVLKQSVQKRKKGGKEENSKLQLLFTTNFNDRRKKANKQPKSTAQPTRQGEKKRINYTQSKAMTFLKPFQANNKNNDVTQ